MERVCVGGEVGGGRGGWVGSGGWGGGGSEELLSVFGLWLVKVLFILLPKPLKRAPVFVVKVFSIHSKW